MELVADINITALKVLLLSVSTLSAFFIKYSTEKWLSISA